MVRPSSCFLLPVIVSLAVAAMAADPPRPVVDAAPDVYTPVPMDQQRLAGAFGGRLRANAEGYLEHVDPEILLAPFQHRASDNEADTKGESAGLFLVAAANAYEYNEDFQLKSVMEAVAKGLIATQEQDGYLGLYTEHARWGAGDVLAQSCNLAGLFAYGRVTGNDDAFDAGHHAADLMLSVFEKNPSTESDDAVAMVEPLAELYRGTGDGRYLTVSKQLLDRHPMPSTVSGQTILFAFGEAELYRLTGTDADLKKAQAAWQAVASTVSIAGAPQLALASKTGGDPDTCALFFWMEASEDLLRVTGAPQYAEVIENLMYNQLLASQDARNGNLSSSTSLQAPVQFRRDMDACSLAEAAALTEIPDAIWGRYGSGVGVLTYAPGRATLRLRRRASIQLYSESSFPESGTIILHVEPTHDTRFPLQLFVPVWTKQFSAEIGATKLLGKPGHFLTLTREWKKGDTVKIQINLTTAVVPDPTNPGRIAIRRGPQLLALSKTLNPQLSNDRPLTVRADAASELKVVDTASVMPLSSAGAQTYTLDAQYGNQQQDLILTPFSDAASNRIWFAAARH